MSVQGQGRMQPRPGDGETQRTRTELEQASIPDLIRRVARDSAGLIREEINLARVELKETARGLTRDGVKLGVGLGLAATGGLALTACLIIVLGNLFDGAYWASSLLVGAMFVLVGGILAARAIRSMRRQRLTPDETIQTLREDRDWAKGEARDFRRDVAA